MDLNTYTFIGSVPLIMGLVEYAKRWVENEKWYPAIAIFLGLAINLIIPWALGMSGRAEWTAAGFMGVIVGLSACGLYSSVETARGA